MGVPAEVQDGVPCRQASVVLRTDGLQRVHVVCFVLLVCTAVGLSHGLARALVGCLV
jgi:hypothetical protein